MKVMEHFLTITHHRKIVRQYCFRVGLFRQGILHDLTKYSPTEFLVGIKYFQGDRSPNNAEKEDKGYSSSWLHHKGRNKHHSEYWIDYSGRKDTILSGMKMPVRFVVEMFFDRIAACRTYQKDAYRQESAWEYHKRSRPFLIMYPESQALLEQLIETLATDGEEAALAIAREALRADKEARRRPVEKVGENICRKEK